MRIGLLVVLLTALTSRAQNVGSPLAGHDAERRARAFLALDRLKADIGYDAKKNVVRIDLKGTDVNDDILKHVRQFTTLQELRLSATRITDEGLAELRALGNLQVLYLSYNRVTDAGLAVLRDLPKLEVVGLSYTGAGDGAAASLAKIKGMQSIAFSHTNLSDAGVKQLSKLQNLRHLYADGTLISAGGVQELKNPLLETLSYRGTRAAATLGNDGFLKQPAPAAPPPAAMMP